MRMPRFTQSARERLFGAAAGLLAALVMLLAVLAVCPEAHEWFHHNAGRADHECAVTLFAHGVTTALAVVTLACVAWHWLGETAGPARVFYAPARPGRLPPGRAPPVR